VKLGDICEIKHGFAFKGEYFCDTATDYLLLTPGNFAIGGGFQEKAKYYNGPIPEIYILKKDDLIVTMTDLSKQGDTLGYSAFVPCDNRYLHNQRIGLITVTSPHALKNYIYWLMRTRDYQRYIVNHASGSTVKHTAPKVILGYEFDLPTLDEQRKIADTLSALDARIAENTKINHHLEQMAQAIFKSWFVDFEPWGGVMPDDWREGMLSEIANITMGQSPSGTSYNEDGIGTVFYQGRAEFGSRFPTRRLFTTEPKRMAAKDDVLMSVRAPVGDLNVAFEPCCLGRGLAGIQSNSGHQSFVLYTMFALKQQLDMFNGEGTVFGSINKNDLANLPVIIPTDEVIRRFQEVASPMDATIETNYAEICNLHATRDSLLPCLMSGEVSLADLAAK